MSYAHDARSKALGRGQDFSVPINAISAPNCSACRACRIAKNVLCDSRYREFATLWPSLQLFDDLRVRANNQGQRHHDATSRTLYDMDTGMITI